MNEWFSLNGAAIQEWLDQESRKQSYLMKSLKTSRATVARMLNGHVPSDPQLVETLAALMGKQSNDLLIPKKAKRAG